MSVQAVELLHVEAGRRAADSLEIEPLDGGPGRDDLVVPMAPAQSQKVVAHGLGQVAHVPIGLDRKRSVALG